jgi:hypothetical protein
MKDKRQNTQSDQETIWDLTERLTVTQLPGYLKTQLPRIKQQLLEGTYQPMPVRQVKIPKSNGGMCKLGIPTVVASFSSGTVAELTSRGVGEQLAAQTAAGCHGPWRLSRSPALSFALPNDFLDRLGVERLLLEK